MTLGALLAGALVALIPAPAVAVSGDRVTAKGSIPKEWVDFIGSSTLGDANDNLTVEANEATLQFPADGGRVSGTVHLATQDTWTDYHPGIVIGPKNPGVRCTSRHEYTVTIVGTYDVATKLLHGTASAISRHGNLTSCLGERPYVARGSDKWTAAFDGSAVNISFTDPKDPNSLAMLITMPAQLTRAPVPAPAASSPSANAPADANVSAPGDVTNGDTNGDGGGGFNPLAGLAGGVGGTAVVAGIVRAVTRRRPPAVVPAPLAQAIYDGNDAIAMLQHQGWITPVIRPDGSTGWQPTGDLHQYLAHDHGDWQPAFAPGIAAPDGNTVSQLVGVAFEPAADGTLDSITVVASVAPPAPPPPAPVTPPPANPYSDLGSQMLLDKTGQFLDPVEIPPEVGPLILGRELIRQGIDALPDRIPAASPAPSPPPVPAPTPVASPPAAPSSPFNALLAPGGGTATITAGDLPRVAPEWFAADGTIKSGLLEGAQPAIQLHEGALMVNVAMHQGMATLAVRDGRIVVGRPMIQGPMASLAKPDVIQARAQQYLDSHLNAPAAAHGLRVSEVGYNGDSITIVTGPTPAP